MRYKAAEDQSRDIEMTLTRMHERTRTAMRIPPNVLLDRWDDRAAVLVRRSEEALVAVGDGIYIGGPVRARLMRALDRVFRRIAVRLNAVEHVLPHLTTWATLHRAQYTRLFPQHLMGCTVVRNDISALDRVAVDTRPQAGDFHATDVFLAPAACLNLYAALRDSTMESDLTATMLAQCGRHEPTGVDSLRLTSFHMREIVFIGDARTTEDFRRRASAELRWLVDQIGLPCRIESANDPFFVDIRDEMAAFQRTFDLKHEIVGRMAKGDSGVAIASLNYHRKHFGDAFGIRLPTNVSVDSACLGFGLERWCEWLLSYFDGDERSWPDVLREHGRGRSE